METILTLETIEAFQQGMIVDHCPANTVKAYTTDMRMLYLAVGSPTTPDDLKVLMSNYLTNLGAAESTIRRKLAAFKKYCRWLGEPGLMDGYRAPGAPVPIPHPIKEGMNAVEAMIAAARKEHHRALLALIGMAGLRVGEALSVTSDAFILNSDGVAIQVRGKGHKFRVVELGDLAWAVIAPAYVAATRLDDKRLVPLTDRAARRTITRIGRRAGFDVASHDFRMTFATEFYEASGKDLNLTRNKLGHSSTNTTQGYVGIDAERSREAVNFGRNR